MQKRCRLRPQTDSIDLDLGISIRPLHHDLAIWHTLKNRAL